MYIKLHLQEPFEPEALVNLDNVLLMKPEATGGTSITFIGHSQNTTSRIIVSEELDVVEEMIENM